MARAGQSIHNPRTGQRMTFVELRPDVLRIDTTSPASSEPDPLHVHPLQESGAEVLSGVLVFELDGERREVRAGESISIPAGVPHRFWNEGAEDAHSIQFFRPALQSAEFFETYFALARDGELGADGMPRLLQLALLVPEFGDEMRPVSPPWFVLRALGAVLGPIAQRRGYRARRV